MVNGYSSNGLPEGGSKGRALLVVTDGLGFDPDTVMRLSSRVIDELGTRTRRSLWIWHLKRRPAATRCWLSRVWRCYLSLRKV